MISVVIPLYNKAEYIADTLQSVLGQTYSDFELIIVNDGSTDDSEKIVGTFNDERMHLISIENSGVSTARNRGVQVAQHPWIAFLDADDWWAPTFLAELVKAMELYPNHSIFTSGRTHVFQNDSKVYSNEFLPEGNIGLVNYFEVISKYFPPINASNVLISKSLLEDRGGFKANMHQHEDHDLWIRLAVNHEIVYVNEPLSFYNKATIDSQSKNTLTADNFTSYLETILKVNNQISHKEKKDFNKYFQRFGTLTYIKYFKQYTVSERESLFPILKKMLKRRNLWIVRIMHTFPFVNFYTLFRLLR